MNNVKALVRIYKQLIYILSPKQKKNALYVFASMIVCSFLELLGVSAIYPFLQLMLDSSAMRETWYLSWIYKIKPNASVADGVFVLGLAIVFVYIIKNVVALLCTYVQYRYAASFQRETSTLMLRSYLKRPYEFFVNTNSSLISRGVGGDTASVYNVLLNGFQILAETWTILLIGVYLLQIGLLRCWQFRWRLFASFL